jgi:hypothetical protein
MVNKKVLGIAVVLLAVVMLSTPFVAENTACPEVSPTAFNNTA